MYNSNKNKKFRLYLILGILFLSFILNIEATLAHGGKGHDPGAFTPLTAIQKATEMFDQLISLKKLDDTWETQLIRIEVISRKISENQEFVVLYKRSSGNPDTVYFFFDITGKYTGSNFTGK